VATRHRLGEDAPSDAFAPSRPFAPSLLSAPSRTTASAPLPGRLMHWWLTRPARRQRALVASLPAALDAVARSLRSGASLSQALAECASSGAESPAARRFVEVAGQVERGVPLERALARWRAEAGGAEAGLVVAALALAQGGGDAARTVEGVAASLRARQSVREEVRVQSVQARYSAMVIALLPVAFTGWCIIADERAATFLLGSPAGWLCLAAGFGLLGIGGWWMARIVRSVA
jgi:tight adherence protein B